MSQFLIYGCLALNTLGSSLVTLSGSENQALSPHYVRYSTNATVGGAPATANQQIKQGEHVITASNGASVLYESGQHPLFLHAASHASVDTLNCITLESGSMEAHEPSSSTVRGVDYRRFIIGTRSVSTASIGSVLINLHMVAGKQQSVVCALSGRATCMFNTATYYPDASLAAGWKVTLTEGDPPKIEPMAASDYASP